jgi:putative ABC transport system ATP-binding protein
MIRVVSEMQASRMLLLKNIYKAYCEPDGTQLPILKVAEFRVDRGEQMLLVGRSGSGKTTLLHVIAGISKPDEGIVEIAGRDITKLSEAVRDRFRADKMGYVFQTFNLLPGFSALENVLLGMAFTRNAASVDRARELLKRVGLEHRLSHRPNALSVGEQQRVAVARALANKPQLLLADEPTANVDAGHQQQIVDLIRETCREEEVALVMVTHTAEICAQFDRVDELSNINLIEHSVA